MAEHYDALIIGAGHNGLVCGAYLAKAGLRVCVLERRDVIGGAAVTEELWPGYRVSVASFIMSLMQPKVILDLDLLQHGLKVLPPPPTLVPFPDGRYLLFHDEVAKTCAEIARFSKEDATAYADFKAHLQRLAPILRRLIWERPFDPVSGRVEDIKNALGFIWRFRDVGGRFYDVLDLLTLSAYDYLQRWFRTDEVLAAIGSYTAASGNNISIRSPGSAYVLMRSLLRDDDTAAGRWGFVEGGMGAISAAIARSGARHGLKIRTGAEVARVIVQGGRARGVALAGGEEVRADTVIANASAQTTFGTLVDRGLLPPEFAARIAHFRTTSAAFKINLAVESPPQFSALAGVQDVPSPSLVRIAPSVEYLERAFDDAKYGGFSRRPYMDIVVPTLHDTTLAPEGKHVINILGGHASYDLAGRSWDDARDELFETVVDTIREFAPGFGNGIIHKQVLTPRDLELRFGLPGGHVHHGDLGADQIFFKRPAPGYADYRSPIAGLYQCGASTHPGGGVTGVPGHNAAHAILQDLRRSRTRPRAR